MANLFDEEMMEEHVKKVLAFKPYAENGLICYSYNDQKQEEGYYTPPCMNIGDYVQSLAAKQFFPFVSVFHDRDQLGEYSKNQVNMIMNAWYALWRKNETFSSQINPLLVSIHLSRKENISQKSLTYFKQNEPIGCRDIATATFLCSKGIKAYFSGCLTLTLGNTYTYPYEKKKEIFFVDWQPENDLKIKSELDNVLKSYKKYKIKFLSHQYPFNNNVNSSLEEAENLIKTYAKASLVITKNIHVALPCLSIGTPVILVVPTFDKNRFYGLIDLLNHIGYDENGDFVLFLQKTKEGLIKNSEKHLKYKNYLTKLCLAFTHQETFNKPEIDWDTTGLNQVSKKIKMNSGIIRKIKYKNGRRRIYFLGLKIFSYKKKRALKMTAK